MEKSISGREKGKSKDFKVENSMSSPERQMLDETSSSTALVEGKDTKVCNQKRIT